MFQNRLPKEPPVMFQGRAVNIPDNTHVQSTLTPVVHRPTIPVGGTNDGPVPPILSQAYRDARTRMRAELLKELAASKGQ